MDADAPVPRDRFFLRLAETGRDLAGFSFLAAAALCIGLLLNHARAHPLPLIRVAEANRTGVNGAAQPVRIELPEFRRLAEGGNAVVIDARPEAFYRLGHVPGAMSLPREAFEREYARREALRDKSRVVAVYCSGADCEDSERVASALSVLGHRKVFVFKGGWEAWTGAGLPTEPER